MRRLAATTLVASLGCLPSSFQPGVVACTTDVDCPSYFHCVDGACGGTDGGAQAGATDAGPACPPKAQGCGTVCRSPCACGDPSLGCCIAPKTTGCRADEDCCFYRNGEGLGCNTGFCNCLPGTSGCIVDQECCSGKCVLGHCG